MKALSPRPSVCQFFPWIIVVRLFQEPLKPEKSLDRAKSEEKAQDFTGVRCPLCKWMPSASSRWYCADCEHPEYFFDGCGAIWNTFTTRGRCPGCGYQWHWTSCLRCAGWSRHEEWYENKHK
jgi:hypothetical protein